LVIRPGTTPAPDFTLTDQDGNTLSLSSLRGRVVALTFLDTLCRNLCPLQARVLGIAESDLGSRQPLTVVIVSVRPEADTPAAIADFATANGLARYRWLTGARAQLETVWTDYGIEVQVANGDLEHGSAIFLIDRSGFERIGFIDVPETSAFENDVKILAATA
jgi:protein SCO1